MSEQVRRATVDDLEQLIELWKMEQLPADILEKRFTEFQVVVDSDGKVLGALGLLIAGTQGMLHGEAFRNAEHSDHFRMLLWKRMASLLQNHGLTRVWTQFKTPFWRTLDFQSPTADVRAKLPPAFGDASAEWQYLQYRPEKPVLNSVDAEFAMFKEAAKAETEEVFRQARVMRAVMTFFGLLLFAGVVCMMVYLWRHMRHN